MRINDQMRGEAWRFDPKSKQAEGEEDPPDSQEEMRKLRARLMNMILENEQARKANSFFPDSPTNAK